MVIIPSSSDIEVLMCLLDIQNTSSTLDKEQLLRENKKNSRLLATLRFIYNPHCRSNISTTRLNNMREKGEVIPSDSYFGIYSMIEYFIHNTTGSYEDVRTALLFINSVENQIRKYDMEIRYTIREIVDMAEAVVIQETKLGVAVTTLNKVYGKDFIVKISPMLGKKIQDVPQSSIKWPCIVTEKLDGIRRIAIKENGKVTYYSRNGKEDPYLHKLLDEDFAYLPDNCMYDGELIADTSDFEAEGKVIDSIALRQLTASRSNCKRDRVGLKLHLFDSVPLSDFNSSYSIDTAIERKRLLGALLNDESIIHLMDNDMAKVQRAIDIYRRNDYTFKNVCNVPILGIVNNLDEALEFAKVIWSAGGEGVMLNPINSAYECKRSNSSLKVKKVIELTAEVLGVEEGTGRNEGRLGSLICRTVNNSAVADNIRFSVGSGFSDEERDWYWENPNRIIEAIIEVDTFGVSTNANGGTSINCPIFKRVIGNE